MTTEKYTNITDRVVKLETKLAKELKVSQDMLNNTLKNEQIEFYQLDGTNSYFYREIPGKGTLAKYAKRFLNVHIQQHLGLTLRDNLCEDITPKYVPKSAVKRAKKVETEDFVRSDTDDLVMLADPEDLKEFVNHYMNGYKISSAFKKKNLSEESKAKFFKEIGSNLTDGIQVIVKRIFGGDKANYRQKRYLSSKELADYNFNCHQEFYWFLDTLKWLAKPSAKYMEQHRKFSIANYMRVSSDLRSVVTNSLFAYRTMEGF